MNVTKFREIFRFFYEIMQFYVNANVEAERTLFIKVFSLSVCIFFPPRQTFHQANMQFDELPFCSCLDGFVDEESTSFKEPESFKSVNNKRVTWWSKKKDLHCKNAISFNWCHCFKCILDEPNVEVKPNAWDTFLSVCISVLFEVFPFFFHSGIEQSGDVSVDWHVVYFTAKNAAKCWKRKLHALACLLLEMRWRRACLSNRVDGQAKWYVYILLRVLLHLSFTRQKAWELQKCITICVLLFRPGSSMVLVAVAELI